jgi:sulfate adenylyltransferase subunit 2
MWIMLDDDRMQLAADESAETRVVRFRTLGCYPLSGAIESQAAGIDDIIRETTETRSSERQVRLIDSDQPASMEIKKQDGYF